MLIVIPKHLHPNNMQFIRQLNVSPLKQIALTAQYLCVPEHTQKKDHARQKHQSCYCHNHASCTPHPQPHHHHSIIADDIHESVYRLMGGCVCAVAVAAVARGTPKATPHRRQEINHSPNTRARARRKIV